jgi:predicted secreted acid phosphatase
MPHFPTKSAPSSARPARSRLSRSMPVVAGSLIAAGGLVFGALATANAQDGSSAHPATKHLSVPQQARKVQRQDAHDPKNGNTTLNVNVLEDQIEHYYGSASATYPNVGTVTIPAKNSNYAKQMKKIVVRAQSNLLAEKRHYKGAKKPAVVFDIDDTLLNTYDYTLSAQFGYDPTTNAVYIDNAAFPAVFDMPHLVRFARNHGFAVFYITGRPESQRASTVKDLTSAGYAAPKAGHLFLKPSTPPSYLTCAKAPSCTTIEYKSGTRKHIQAGGFKILSDFGDQYSDLLGGAAGHQVKIPNPMYYIP